MIVHFWIFALLISLTGANAFSGTSRCDEPLHLSMYESSLVSFKDEFNELRYSSQQWKDIANLLLFLTIIIAIFGACISSLQAVEDSFWKKMFIGFLGVLIAVVTISKDNFPEGNYKAYQHARNIASNLEKDLNLYFHASEKKDTKIEDLKDITNSICKLIDKWRELKTMYSSEIPSFLGWMVKSSHAQPTKPIWMTTSPQGNRIVSNGTGLSISEAKSDAEQKGSNQIDEKLQGIIDPYLQKPIYSTIKKDIKDNLKTLSVLQKETFLESSGNQSSYWILYEIDEKRINKILSGIIFPLELFTTNLISDKTTILKKELSDYGFSVSESASLRGPNSETNAIFVGSGVPVNAVKELVQKLIAQDIPLKGIVYPWPFQRSRLPETQKLNLVQIGGTLYFESWPKLSQEELDRLKNISSQGDLIELSKKYTDTLRKEFGLE